MKADEPILPKDPEKLAQAITPWLERTSQLINEGLYEPRILSTAPAVGDMDEGEMAVGVATGPSSEHEIFVKVNSTTIARFYHDATIT